MPEYSVSDDLRRESSKVNRVVSKVRIGTWDSHEYYCRPGCGKVERKPKRVAEQAISIGFERGKARSQHQVERVSCSTQFEKVKHSRSAPLWQRSIEFKSANSDPSSPDSASPPLHTPAASD